MVEPVAIPEGVLRMVHRGPDWAGWVARLPRLVADLLEEWELAPDGASTHGFTALVVPVVDRRGSAGVLKVGFPDEESEHEHLALAHWNGAGAAQLLRADPRRRAMLIERLEFRSLNAEWDIAACEIVGRLYGRLHLPAFAQLRPLSTAAAAIAEHLGQLPRDAPLPRRLVEQATSLSRTFANDPDTDGTLIHTDLHYDNVLAGTREPWLAIDPKPLSGDPHYEIAPMLWNRYDELAGRVRQGLRQRFHTLVDVAGLDESRARDWVIVRMLAFACDRLTDPAEDRRITAADELLTLCVAIAKAVQD